MIEVIDQYGERHRFDDNHCIHDADSATGVVQIGMSNDSGDYDVVATFFHPARFGEVSDDTRFTLREVPAGSARQIEELRAELAAAQATIADVRSNLLAASCYIDCLGGNSKAYRIAHAIPTNQNALHEALARECERLAGAEGVEEGHSDWLLKEAAAHRARKEVK